MKYIFVGNKKIYVSEEVYKEYRRSERREKYLIEQSQAHGDVSYDCLFVEPATDSAEEAFEKKQRSDILWAALGKLSEKEFEFINLHFFEGFTLNEIAEMTSTSYIKCWRKKKWILAKLRSIIGDNLQL